MITSTPTPDGYIFNLRGNHIAVGVYGNGDFTLIESDNTTTAHRSGMMALAYLRQKHTPEFYSMPVKACNDIKPRAPGERRSLFSATEQI
jgi:hypothetical protein